MLRHIERLPGGRAGYKQLVRELGLGGGQERRVLREQLGRLTGTRQLVQVDGEHWVIPQAGICEAGPTRAGISAAERNERHARDSQRGPGRGAARSASRWVRICAADAGAAWRARPPIGEDVFIPPGEMGGAMQGDQVLVELAAPRFGRGDGRRSGRVLRDADAAQSDGGGDFPLRAALEDETGEAGTLWFRSTSG